MLGAPHYVGAEEQSPYRVNGVYLHSKVAPQGFKCGPSKFFSGFVWCRAKSNSGRVSITDSILHSMKGEAEYLSRSVEPAYFRPGEVQQEINRLSDTFGSQPTITNMPSNSHGLNGMIAAWGGLVLEPVSGVALAELGNGRNLTRSFLVDFVGSPKKSVRLGLPVYRISGTDGFIWVASVDRRGQGSLSFRTL